MLNISNQNHNNLKQEFKKHFLDSINQLKNNKKILIGLSGGSSLSIFYADFINIFTLINSEIRNKIYFCLLDERIVPQEYPDSNYKQLRETFLDELLEQKLITNEQILVPDFNKEDYALDYFNQVKKIDIGLFGVGPDCHTCSLFPNHKLLDDKSYGYIKITDSPKEPKERITISVNMLTDTTFAFVFFMGENKKEAKNMFFDTSISTYSCPVKLTLLCKNTIVIND